MTAYTIKPLRWDWDSRSPGWDSVTGHWKAKTPVGDFSVWPSGIGSRWRLEGEFSRPCESIDDGKAKAEAYYRERLLPALVPVSASIVICANSLRSPCQPSPKYDPGPEGRT